MQKMKRQQNRKGGENVKERLYDFPFNHSQTMKIIGKQHTGEIIKEKEAKEIDDVLETARCRNLIKSEFEVIVRVFILGYIYGKRAERAKRKKK